MRKAMQSREGLSRDEPCKLRPGRQKKLKEGPNAKRGALPITWKPLTNSRDWEQEGRERPAKAQQSTNEGLAGQIARARRERSIIHEREREREAASSFKISAKSDGPKTLKLESSSIKKLMKRHFSFFEA
jgi:hypothetical protein